MFLDVDGTLLDVALRPDAVHVNHALKRDLAQARHRLGGALALLSGRPLSELDELLDWQGHTAAGLHGVELRMPDGSEQFGGDPCQFSGIIGRARSMAGMHPGILLEDKRRALALHFRDAPQSRDDAIRIAEILLADCGERYTLQHGDHVVELKPAGSNKGIAIGTLMDSAPFRGRRPWVLGDDLTDEDAFHYVNAHAGISVIVGQRRPTAASHALANPAMVRAWLHAVAAG